MPYFFNIDHRTPTGCFPFLFAVMSFISRTKMPFFGGFWPGFPVLIAVLQTGQFFLSPA